MILGNPFQEPVIYIGNSLIFFLKINFFFQNSHDSRHNLQKSPALKKQKQQIYFQLYG